MAPGPGTYTDLTPTNIFIGAVYAAGYYQEQKPKKESDKEKRDRVSLEKKLASQKIYNDRTPTIKIIKQVCKPRHYLHARAF